MKKIILLIFLIISLLVRGQVKTEINSSIFLGPTGDTISAKEYVSLLNSGLYQIASINKEDSATILKLDSTSLLKLFFKKAPVTTFKTENNKFIKLMGRQEYILHFWNSNCKPCIEEMDEILSYLKKNPKTNFLFITTDKKEIADKILKPDINHINSVVEAKSIEKLFQVDSYPTTILIDKGGLVRMAFFEKIAARMNTLF